MKKILLFITPAFLLLTSCDLFNSYGKKVKINDKNEIYYKGDSVTEADAKNLGNYLLKTGYFNPQKGATVQLTKDNDKYIVRMVYDKTVFDKNKDQISLILWFLQDQISENVFNGKKVNIALADDKLKDFETLDEVNKVTVGKNNTVYYRGSGVNEKDAKNIGDSLAVAQFFDYTSGDILLTKDKGTYAIRFMPSEEKQKEKGAAYTTVLENYKYIISKYILKGDDVDLYVLDKEYNDAEKIKDPNDQRKAQIDQLMNGQQQTEPTNQYNQNQNNQPQYPQQQNDSIVGGSY